jgi:hypothetical protein
LILYLPPKGAPESLTSCGIFTTTLALVETFLNRRFSTDGAPINLNTSIVYTLLGRPLGFSYAAEGYSPPDVVEFDPSVELVELVEVEFDTVVFELAVVLASVVELPDAVALAVVLAVALTVASAVALADVLVVEFVDTVEFVGLSSETVEFVVEFTVEFVEEFVVEFVAAVVVEFVETSLVELSVELLVVVALVEFCSTDCNNRPPELVVFVVSVELVAS